MMAAVGPCVFTLKTNLQTIKYNWQNAYAKHDVVGISPVYEDMGPGESTVDIDAIIFPRAIGVDGGFTVLLAASKSRIPLPFILGDLSAIGWVVVDSIKRTDTELDPAGLGHEIQFQAKLMRSGTPSGLGMIQSILRLLW